MWESHKNWKCENLTKIGNVRILQKLEMWESNKSNCLSFPFQTDCCNCFWVNILIRYFLANIFLIFCCLSGEKDFRWDIPPINCGPTLVGENSHFSPAVSEVSLYICKKYDFPDPLTWYKGAHCSCTKKELIPHWPNKWQVLFSISKLFSNFP